jgi:hypothetical protein
VAWLIFLGFGSAVLTLYYCHIHYFPEVRWEETFTYLAAVTVIGGIIVAIYALLLYIPGWIWSEFLIFDTELHQGTLCYLSTKETKHERRHEPCFRGIWIHLVLPFAVLMGAIHVAMFANSRWLTMIIAVAALIGLMYYSYWEFRYALIPGQQKTQAPQSSLLLKYTATSGIAALASIASVSIIHHAIDPQGHSGQMLFVCTLVVVISNLLVAVQFRAKPTRAALTGVLAAITLLTCGEIFPVDGQTPAKGILKSFGIGDEELEVNLVITVPGRKLLADSGVAVVEKVTLKSRLGEGYLVEWHEDRKDGGQIERRAALPKSMVDYWTSSRKLKSDNESDKKPELSLGQIVAGFASGLLVVLLFGLHDLIQGSRKALGALAWVLSLGA